MGIFDYVSDLYAAMTIQEVQAEEPQKDDGGDEGSDGGDEKQEESSEGGEGEEGGDSEGGDEEGGEEGGDEEEEEEEEEEEDEPQDIKPQLEEECMKTSQCAPLKHHYEECAERVKHQEEQYGKASENCVEEFFHMMHCASSCAAPKLFRQLK